MLNAAILLQNHLSYEMAITDVERFFSLLYSPFMNMYPKKRNRVKYLKKVDYDRNRPWVFLGGKNNTEAVATLSTLFAYLNDPKKETTYFTPASFYRKDRRIEEAARWIHAITLDIDVKGKFAHLEGISALDVLSRIEDAGLPKPTAIVQTPSGGFQPTWIFNKPIRATEKARVLFKIIQRNMAADIEADMQATGVQNLYRTPTEETLVYFEPSHTYSFQTFIDWRDINHPRGEVRTFWGSVDQTNIMNHAAIQKLMTQPATPGIRDNSCLTLVLAMKFSGYSEEECEASIHEWFNRCVENGGKTPLTTRKITNTVKRIYGSSKLNAPSPTHIKYLTGISFSYDDVRYFSMAKPRQERTRSHLHESKEDLLTYLDEHKNISGSIKEIAHTLNMPQSTLKHILKDFINEGVVKVETKRGRNGSTTISRNCEPKDPITQEEQGNVVRVNFQKKTREDSFEQLALSIDASYLLSEVPLKNSYTRNTIDRRVGGSFSFSAPSVLPPD